MKIVHISDTHGARGHSKLIIPECDVLVHTGDIGGRTSSIEVAEFLNWFIKQPAKCKIFIAGNHDISLDANWLTNESFIGQAYLRSRAMDEHKEALRLISSYSDIVYLKDSGYEYEGIKFWGSPYSPSFHREYWAFNADRGVEISRIWSKIPSDTNVLLTHGPAFGILDMVNLGGRTAWHKKGHVGCEDLLKVIKKRLLNLHLHCSGHIHDNTAVEYSKITNTRTIISSNGAVLSNDYKQVVTNPLIINI